MGVVRVDLAVGGVEAEWRSEQVRVVVQVWQEKEIVTETRVMAAKCLLHLKVSFV